PFNFLTVRLSGEPFDDIKNRCNFDDIRTQYLMLRSHLKGMTCGLFERIAVLDDVVKLKSLPAFLSPLVQQADSGASEKGSVIQPQIGWEASSSAVEKTVQS